MLRGLGDRASQPVTAGNIAKPALHDHHLHQSRLPLRAPGWRGQHRASQLTEKFCAAVVTAEPGQLAMETCMTAYVST
jgi:hypothetical protein